MGIQYSDDSRSSSLTGMPATPGRPEGRPYFSKAVVARLLREDYPTLHPAGFFGRPSSYGTWFDPKCLIPVSAADYVDFMISYPKARRTWTWLPPGDSSLLDSQYLAQINDAAYYIQCCCIQTVQVQRYRATGSYGWKHRAERWLLKKERCWRGVSNGAFIAAAQLSGYRVQLEGYSGHPTQNACFNMRLRWRKYGGVISESAQLRFEDARAHSYCI